MSKKNTFKKKTIKEAFTVAFKSTSKRENQFILIRFTDNTSALIQTVFFKNHLKNIGKSYMETYVFYDFNEKANKKNFIILNDITTEISSDEEE